MAEAPDLRTRIAIAQVDLLVGDIEGNCQRVIDEAERARDELGAAAVVFPELTLCGYPPEDLLLRPALHERVERALERLRREVRGITLVVGHPHREHNLTFNSASVLHDGHTLGRYHKRHLPNYGVFDEKRYFSPGDRPCVVELGGLRVGITICEDVWNPGPVCQAVEAGAEAILNLNASPFHLDKGRERERALEDRIREAAVPIVYVNLVGGQDELVFDGESFVMDGDGRVTQRAPAFLEALLPVELSRIGGRVQPLPGAMAPVLSEEESAYRALVLGVRDYVEKNGFPGAVIGLSGGIDSALTLAVAVDALGAERVVGVSMPSRYTAEISIEDARIEAERFGCEFHILPIEPPFQAFLDTLSGLFAGLPADTTEENIQARCRGILLMAISNKRGHIVLTTGNKSEMAVGYATLYGDMAGGFGVLKDVPKTLVYRLVEYRNSVSRVIPQRVVERPPSAELAPDQRDEDALPPYAVLDPILERYVERDQCVEEIVAAGFDRETVMKVVTMVDRNEYKRRQAPPGVRITSRAFGRDRRYPITNGFGRHRGRPE